MAFPLLTGQEEGHSGPQILPAFLWSPLLTRTTFLCIPTIAKKHAYGSVDYDYYHHHYDSGGFQRCLSVLSPMIMAPVCV